MVLVIAAGAAVVMVDCSKLRPSITVTATFNQVGQLAEGADVQIAGRVVGQVDAIQLVPKSGGGALRLRIQERYAGWAAPNGEYFITAKGVLGEPYLEIGPPPDGAARARGLEDGDTVRGIDPPRMDQVLVRSFANMTAFRRLVDQVTPSARQLRTALDALATELDAIEPTPGAYRGFARSIGELGDAWEALATDWRQAGADPGEWVRLGRTASDVMDRARGELQRVGAALDRLTADIDRVRARLPDDLVARLERSLDGARAAVARLEAIAATGQELAARVRRGQGTIGALMNDPEFSDDAKQLGRILKREPWRVIGHPLPERAPARPPRK